ncbi:MAG: leucine-rich repeat domain-containing protein [Bacteroidetes bacterium]|nr:leucine-rich repeat domain-containing protein [Bacteroidota bacterium]
MKKIFKKLTLACLLPIAAMAATFAQNVAINSTNFPDANFRAWALAQPWGSDAVLTPTEAAAIATINVAGKGIASLEGIQYFPNLKTLDCSKNQLTSLNVSALTHLQTLDCYNNQLISLDLSALAFLKYLQCQNQTPTLTLSADGTVYSKAVALNNPAKLVAGVSYAGGKLVSNSNTIATTPFEVNVAGRSDKMTGTITLLYGGTVVPTNPFCGGTGTESDPYQICTAEQLNQVRNYLDASFKLMNDIDLTQFLIDNNDGGQGWLPIGTAEAPFTGTFNGNNKKIAGLWINRPTTNNIGLFGAIKGNVPGVPDKPIISNVSVEIAAGKEVKGGSNVGGLVGQQLAGGQYSTNFYSPAISDCSVTGNVSGNSTVGGLMGYSFVSSSSTFIENCYATGNVSAAGSVAGGLIGSVFISGSMGGSGTADIVNCYATGNVTGTDYIGGLIGDSRGNSFRVSNSYATGNVTGNNYVGGFIAATSGWQGGTPVTNCYATGNVTGADYVGGFIGQSICNITNCYSIGKVTGTGANVGGLTGNHSWTFNFITSSYYDSTTSGQSDTGKGTPKTTAELKTQSTFTGWNFAVVWKMCPGSYPILQWQPITDCDNFPIPTPSFCGGAGTPTNPYQICTTAQLNEVRNHLDASFILMNDIDLTSFIAENDNVNGWLPIGTAEAQFKGVFNGAGYKITGLWIDRTISYVGLFGCAFGATISNVGVEIPEGKEVKGENSVGGLVGSNHMSTTVTNCYATGNVSGNGAVGGLVGANTNTGPMGSGANRITGCYATGNVTGNDYVGGLVGSNSNSYVTNCYATGNVSGNEVVGGLVGYSNGYKWGAAITNCYAIGKVIGENKVGGFAGEIGTSYINNSLYNYTVNPTLESVGFGSSEWAFGASITTLKIQTTFTERGWNFAADGDWKMCPGSYPILQWQPITDCDNFPVYSPFCGGTGTDLDPYKICTAEQLNEVRNYLDKSFILMNDIDLTQFLIDNSNAGLGWLPIGPSTMPFTGNFNGAGHKITGLWMKRTSVLDNGLFGVIEGAIIDNVGISATSIKGLGQVGALAGVSRNSTIKNCYATGNVSGIEIVVGGLVGILIDGSTVTNSYATGNVVSGEGNVGGLVGCSHNSTIANCYATGNVSETGVPGGPMSGDVGGLVGVNANSSTIINCYATGNVSGYAKEDVGGLVGTNYDATIINCYATGNVVRTGSRIGGLVGRDQGSTTNSFYDSQTTGQSDTGKGTPKTTAEMKTQSTFTDWNFAAGGDWKMCPGSYPILQWQPMSDCDNFPVTPTCAGIAINATNFPDAIFRAWALAQPWGSDACISAEEIAGIKLINVANKGIQDLTGIEYFTGLQYLYCSGNQLTSLNVSALTNLKLLYCQDNQLASLNVSALIHLQELNCSRNKLTALDVSALVNLQALYCTAQIATLTLNTDGAVYSTAIALNNPTKLAAGITYAGGKLISNSNTIASTPFEVVVPGSSVKLNGTFTLLYNNEVIVCTHNFNALGTLVSAATCTAPAQHKAKCSLCGEEHATLLLNGAPALGHNFTLWIVNPSNANQEIEVCSRCGVPSGNTRPVAPSCIAVNATNFPDANFRAWVAAQGFVIGGCIPTGAFEGIKTIDVSGLNIADLTGINYFTGLQYLNCSNNQLSALDVSGLGNLKLLNCQNNQLATLDLTNNTHFQELYHCGNAGIVINTSGLAFVKYIEECGETPTDCDGIAVNATNFPDANFRAWILAQSWGSDECISAEEIAGIRHIELTNKGIQDLTGINYFTGAVTLYCGLNQLTSLDVSALTNLKILHCRDNQLTSLNVSTLVHLQELNCSRNKLTELDVRGLTNLKDLFCTGNLFSAPLKSMEQDFRSDVETSIIAEDAIGINVYPNPTTDKVYLTTEASVKVFNPQGGLLYSGFGKEVDLSGYAKGLYILQINGTSVVKVMKQ